MAGSPRYTIHSPAGEYVASCKYPEDGAAIVALYGTGAQIRARHKKPALWTEGEEVQSAGESFDFVAETVRVREGNR